MKTVKESCFITVLIIKVHLMKCKMNYHLMKCLYEYACFIYRYIVCNIIQYNSVCCASQSFTFKHFNPAFSILSFTLFNLGD